MPRAIATIMVTLFLAGTPAKAGAETCNAAFSNASPFYCMLERVDTVRLRLQGSAETLSAQKQDLEQIMRQRMAAFVAGLPKSAKATPSPLIGRHERRGALLCTLWTVGETDSIALFVECALESTATGDSVEARLLGRTTKSEFDMASRVALGQVVSSVIDRYEQQRGQRIALQRKHQIKTAGPSR